MCYFTEHNIRIRIADRGGEKQKTKIKFRIFFLHCKIIIIFKQIYVNFKKTPFI